MLQVRFAEPDAGVQVERIEAAILGQHGLGDLGGGGMRHAVGRADDEAVEGIARIERRALEAADVRAPGRKVAPGRDSGRRGSLVGESAAAEAWAARRLGLPGPPGFVIPGCRTTMSIRSAPSNSAAQHSSRSSA